MSFTMEMNVFSKKPWNVAKADGVYIVTFCINWNSGGLNFTRLTSKRDKNSWRFLITVQVQYRS